MVSLANIAAKRTLRPTDAYDRGLADRLLIRERDGVDPIAAKRLHVVASLKGQHGSRALEDG